MALTIKTFKELWTKELMPAFKSEILNDLKREIRNVHIHVHYVLNILGENDYPKRFLNDCLRSPVCRNQNNSEGDTSVKGYAIVPYIQGVTEPIKRILSNCNIKESLSTTMHCAPKPAWRPF